MKFIVSTNDLLKQLDTVDGVIVSKPLIPILENFLFKIEGNELHIATTDLETFMTTSVQVESDGNILVAVPARVAMETLKALPTQPVTFSIDKKSNLVEINTGSGRYKITGQDGKEFPKLPDHEADNSISIPANVLLKALNKTVFATGTDELRLNLTGVYCEVTEKALSFVATDANRLVKYTRNDIKPGFTANFILPKKALNLLKNSLPNDDTAVKMDLNKSYAFFSFGKVSLMCRLIDERYPDYNAVIPTENPNKLSLHRQDFMSSLKRTSIYSNKTTHQIRMKVAGSELNISAEDFDFANEANERLSCNYEGEDIEIGFNARYLGEMIAAIDTEDVKMEMSIPSRAGIIMPTSNDAGEDLMMLIMPMMLNNN